MSKYQITDDEIFVEHPQKTFVLTFYTRNSYINYLFRKLLEFSDGVWTYSEWFIAKIS